MDLATLVKADDDGLKLVSELSTDFLAPETVRGWNRRYLELLSRLVEDPAVKVAQW